MVGDRQMAREQASESVCIFRLCSSGLAEKQILSEARRVFFFFF